MRVCLDTNVLVSAFATRGLSADVLNLILAEHQFVVGETVLSELERILAQKLKVPAETVEETLAFLQTQAVVVSHAPPLGFKIRDEDDEPVLAEAIEGLTEVLVTGDKDLLVVAAKAPIRILTPRGFWDEIRADQDDS